MASQTIPGLPGVNNDLEEAYLNNYGAHRIGISADEVVEYYNHWSKSGSYENVRTASRS